VESIMVIPINELWRSSDPCAWDDALARYWERVPKRNLELERSLDALDLNELRRMNAPEWCAFLRNKYFQWKFTDGRVLARNRTRLRRYEDDDALDVLDDIRGRLLALNVDDVGNALIVATEIHGLGIAGASGLLAIMYPRAFGTVDQFVVKALREIDGLPEAKAVEPMNPKGLSIHDGVRLNGILRRKAADLNRVFGTDAWTPSKVEMMLWSYRV
jgi:hypothetical protein